MQTTSLSSRIILDKTYPIQEMILERAEEWAIPLWEVVDKNVGFSVDVSALRNSELKNVLHERFVNYVFSRLIIGACHALKIAREEEVDEKQQNELLANAVDAVLDIEQDIRDIMVWYLKRLGERIINDQSDPSDGQRKIIVRKAVEDGHRCYICGRSLHYAKRPLGSDDTSDIDKIRGKRAFEIEHVWSKARGGSRSRANLAASCNDCNKVKLHLLSFVDMAIEQIMTIATSPKSIRSALGKYERFALMWYQEGRCCFCDRHFYEIESEKLFLVRRENGEPYHFFNMMAACEDCNESRELDGVDLRA